MFDVETKQSITQIIEEIIKRENERSNRATTFRETPLLKNIHQMLKTGLDEERDSLLFAYDVYLFLSEQYAYLGRMSIAADYHFEALLIAASLYDKYAIKKKDIVDVFSTLLQERNYYVDDNCEDVLRILEKTPLIASTKIKEIYEHRMNNRRHLKHDPIEMSKEYLDVIDEVEEKIEQNRTLHGLGSCHEIWMLKCKFLAEKGIIWKSPALLNPRVMFD